MIDKSINTNINLNFNEIKNAIPYRLSTHDRTALSLNSSHIGFHVYDTDEHKPYWWSGSTWQTYPTTSGGSQISAVPVQLPYVDTPSKWKSGTINVPHNLNSLYVSAHFVRQSDNQEVKLGWKPKDVNTITVSYAYHLDKLGVANTLLTAVVRL